MNLRDLKDRFLASPWVYDFLRPLVAGGIDLQSLADFCELSEKDRVFDLGCGTAQLLEFLACGEYLGVDLDSRALERASRFSSPAVRFMEGDDWDESYRALRPTVVLMIGVVHHVPDAIFESIVRRIKQSDPPPDKLITIDVTYLPGHWVNNMLSLMDRGRHVRKPGQYERLFTDQGLKVLRNSIIPTRLRYVRYIGYHLSLT